MKRQDRSRLGAWSAFKLWIQRSLAAGGWSQLMVPIILALVIWLLLTGLLAFLVRIGSVSPENLIPLKHSLDGENIWGISFFHLFSNGGQDLMVQGPGWLYVMVSNVLVALLTAVFTNFFDKAAINYLEGLSDYRVRNHVAILGFDSTSADLVRQMVSGAYGDDILLILTTYDIPDARAALEAVLSKKQMRKIILLKGDPSTPGGLARMQVADAREIHIIGDEAPSDALRDVHTMECLAGFADLIPAGSRRKPCYVMLEQRAAFAALQTSDLGGRLRDSFDFFPLNRYEMWAHRILICRSLDPDPAGFLPLEGTSGIGPDSPDYVHLVIEGMTPMGIALALESAHLGHFPNFFSHRNCRTRISFIDKNVQAGKRRMEADFPGMFTLAHRRFVAAGDQPLDDAPWTLPSGTEHLGGDFLDFEWEFIQGDSSHPAVRQYLAKAASNPCARLTAAVCLEDAGEALASATGLPREVLDRAVQVLVYQREGGSVVEALQTSQEVRFRKIKAFGMAFRSFDLDLVNELVGTAGAFRKDSAGTAEEAVASKSEAARMWSNIYNASHIWTKLRSAGSVDGTIPDGMMDILAMTEHNRWNAEQLLLRFRPLTSGEQKAVLDAGEGFLAAKGRLKREQMAHLDICSWERLAEVDPEVVQYDYNFVEQI